MLFSSCYFNRLPDIYFNGDKLEWVCNIKYLGVIIDNKLKLNLHINELCKKVSKFAGAIYSLSKLMPKPILININYSLVQSIVCQIIIICGAAPVTTIQTLKVKINNILRIILKVRRINNIPNMPTSTMYKELKILKKIIFLNLIY